MKSLKKEVKMLTKKELRKSILLKEILGRPKALDSRITKYK